MRLAADWARSHRGEARSRVRPDHFHSSLESAAMRWRWAEACWMWASKEARDSFEAHIQQASAHRHLIAADSRLEWKWSGLTRDLASPLWLLAQSAANLMLSDQLANLRGCASETCRWLFL